MIIRSGLLAGIRWSVCMLKSHRSICVSFSRTGAGLCIYYLLARSNLNFLHISQWITLPAQSCLALYSFCANLLHLPIMWLIVSSLLPHSLHLLFCCFLSILSLIIIIIIIWVFLTRFMWSPFTGVWVTASFPWTSGLCAVFLLILVLLKSGWSQSSFCFWILTVFFPNFWGRCKHPRSNLYNYYSHSTHVRFIFLLFY